LAERIGANRQQLRSRLAYLENTQRINQQNNQRGSIITILNYNKFQSVDDDEQPTEQPQRNQHVTNSQPTANHIVNKETKEQRNKETIKTKAPSAPKKTKPPLLLTPTERALATDWLKYQQEASPSSDGTVQSIGEDLAKLKRVVVVHSPDGKKHKLNDEQLSYILKFINRPEEFWYSRAWSAARLLKRSGKGGPRKIDTILSQIKQTIKKSEYITNPLEE